MEGGRDERWKELKGAERSRKEQRQEGQRERG